MYARMTKVRGAQDVDEIVRDHVLPRARELDGFKGVIAFVDRETNDWMTFTLWDSEEAMRASEEAANQIRSDAMERMNVTEAPTVKTFEVAMAELDSPLAAQAGSTTMTP